MSVLDPYKTLQVDPDAEDEVIVAAYRRLARKYHPDVSSDPESHAKMSAINQAWELLRDPVRRAAVDRARVRTMGSASRAAAADAQARTASARHGARGASGASGVPPERPGPSHEPSPRSDPAGTPGSSRAGGAARQSWPTGRVPLGGFASGASSRPDGEGAAGPPPGNPSGSVLTFGRYAGWSLGEIARAEVDYLEWLDRMPIGRIYRHEIDELLRAAGRRAAPNASAPRRGGLFGRR